MISLRRMSSAQKHPEPPLPDALPQGKSATIVRLPQTTRSDAELVAAMRRGEAWAAAALLDRHGPLVERLIRRIMGHDSDLPDLVQDAFATILSSIDQVRDENAVKAWMSSIAVHTAHRAIRRRQLSRWIFFWQHDDAVDAPTRDADHGARECVRHVYAALEQLPAEERIVFALRFIEEMQLEDIAATRGVSLATIKRRITRAEQRFVAIAQRDPVLRPWLEEGRRWT
jgi:RNA polymerase sigma-70 factor, ECF subfamily